ncbi:indole-3-glycerol-phosphate synthase [Sulfolobales archaeon HS-7]|nr:indole-3-glycerol-phosphate synthase [Sulfolobales archaeon HS-7]
MPRLLDGWLKEVTEISLNRIPVDVQRTRKIHSLSTRIGNSGDNTTPIIAEYKRGSPSGLEVSIDPVEYSTFMQNNGAVGLSVVTEEKFFKGDYELLREIGKWVSIPILMKDFVVSPMQVETAFNIGADAILLIATILTERELEDLYEYAKSFNLEVIVEISNEKELEIINSLQPDMIGVNSRNLRDLKIDLNKSSLLLSLIPKNMIKIAESGITSKSEILMLRKAGADAFLIGTSLLQNPEKIREFTANEMK